MGSLQLTVQLADADVTTPQIDAGDVVTYCVLRRALPDDNFSAQKCDPKGYIAKKFLFTGM